MNWNSLAVVAVLVSCTPRPKIVEQQRSEVPPVQAPSEKATPAPATEPAPDPDRYRESANVLFERGRNAFAEARWGDATVDLRAFVQYFGSDPRVEYAAQMVIECLATDERWDELEALISDWKEDTHLLQPARVRRQTRVDPTAGARRRAEELERKEDWAGRGHAYLKLVSSQTRGVDELLYNAGVCFEMARMVPQASATYEELRRRAEICAHAEIDNPSG